MHSTMLYQCAGTLFHIELQQQVNCCTDQCAQGIDMLRSDVKCAEFIAEMMQFNTDMFVFVNQTGSDRKNSIKKFDYGLKGIANFKKNNT